MRITKTFVLDTNVLIHDPGALFHFEHSRVVIPLAVNGLSNLVDRFKGQPLFGTIRFEKTVRSALAALANELL